MKKVLPFLKNKYLISTVVAIIYMLLLHESDIFALQNKKSKVSDLQEEIQVKRAEIEDLKIALNELDDPRTLEKYAREYHYFKKPDEDVFVFSFE